MNVLKKVVIAATGLAMTATPVLAADAKAQQARAATPVAQSEQMFGDGDWLIWAIIGIAIAVGLVLLLDDPASP